MKNYTHTVALNINIILQVLHFRQINNTLQEESDIERERGGEKDGRTDTQIKREMYMS